MTEPNEGPVGRSHSWQSCTGCVWHTAQLEVSGRTPVYLHRCQHPDAYYHPDVATMTPIQRETALRILDHVRTSMDNGQGRRIGNEDMTPDWCPVVRLRKGDIKGTNPT